MGHPRTFRRTLAELSQKDWGLKVRVKGSRSGQVRKVKPSSWKGVASSHGNDQNPRKAALVTGEGW